MVDLKADVVVLKNGARELNTGFVRMEGQLGRIETRVDALESQRT